MARLSSPESVIKKLESIHQKVDQLCETVTRVEEIRNGVAGAYQSAQKHENEIREKVGDVSALEKRLNGSIRKLESVRKTAEETLARIRGEAKTEIGRVDAALRAFDDQRTQLDRHRRVTAHEVAIISRDVTEKMSYLSEDIQNALGQVHQEAERYRYEHEAMINERTDRIFQTVETATEEIGFLEEKLAAFKQFIWRRLGDDIEAAAEQQRIYRESTTFDLHNRFDEAAEQLREQSEAEMQALQAEFSRRKDDVEKALAVMEAERAAVVRHHQQMAQDLSRMKQDVADLVAEGRDRLGQSIEESHAVIEREVEHVASFISESEEEIQAIRGDVQSFKARLDETAKAEMEKLFRQRTEFEQKVDREIAERFGAESSRLRQLAEKELQRLSSDKKEISEMHRMLDETVAGVNRKITGKTTFFTTQLNNLIVNAQKEISRATADVRKQVEERLAALSDEGEKNRTAMREAREGLNGFTQQVRERMAKESERVAAEQAAFRDQMIRKVSEKLAEEVETIRKDAEKRLTVRFEEMLRQQKEAQASLQKQSAEFEKRMAARETEQREWSEARRADVAKQNTFLKRMDGVQKEQEKRIEPLEARLRAIEAALEALSQKKGLLSFLNKG